MRIFYLTDLLSPYRTVWMNLLSNEYEVDAYFFDETEKTRENTWLHSIKNNFNKYPVKSHTLLGVRFSREAFKILRKKDYDIYIIDGYNSLVQVKAITKLAKEGKNVFVNVDGIDIWRKRGMPEKPKRFIKSRLYKSGAKFLCGSQIAVQRIIKLGAKPENVFKHPFTTIYKSDIISFENKKNWQEKYKEKIGASGKKVALAVGRFIPLKRYEDLIKAWKKIGSDCILYLIGSGELKDNYLKLIDELSIKNITIVDHLSREELDKYYIAADLFIHTSGTEVWGLVFNEAMSKGCPVISTNHCVGAVELIENGKEGYLVNVGDTGDLYNKINAILYNDPLRLSMMQNSLNRISEYTYENLVTTHINIFKNSLSGERPYKKPSLIKKIWFGVIQRAILTFYKMQKGQISVFVFHKVCDNVKDNDELNIKTGTFIEFIDSLKERKTVFSPVCDIFSPGNKVIISFDDVFDSAVQNAIPYLEKNNIPYVLFISPSLIDVDGYITSAHIKSLAKSPLCTIGFHSNSHILMRDLNKEELESQIDCSKFEEKYGIKCDYFAYPYGSVMACSLKNIRALKNSKYLAAFGTVNTATTDKLNEKYRFYIPRISIGENNWKSVLSSFDSTNSNCESAKKKVLFINGVCGTGSTGRICVELAKQFSDSGADARIAYGRSDYVPEEFKKYAVRIGNPLSVKFHAIKTRITDKHGLGSKFTTKSFLKWADAFDPDILWLHNIHGYYVNYEMLFDWIKSRPNMEVRWTLHDCWAFTGHCTHFTIANCSKWKSHCEHCPQKNEYPKCSLIDNSAENFDRKRTAFTGVKNLTLITPSAWLSNLVKQSFLGEYPIEVIYNTVNTDIFKPTQSNFTERYNLQNKKIILGVASIWNKAKGFDDFIRLSKIIDDTYIIVLVGLEKEQIKLLPDNILGIQKITNASELAEIYTAAYVFVNLTYEDNYPTVNLEAQACGARVITYSTGGCSETIVSKHSKAVATGDISAVYCSIIND